MTDYETNLLNNLVKTTVYYFDALADQDIETAELELSELKFLVRELDFLQIKKRNKKRINNLVKNMKSEGINIDYASNLIKKNSGMTAITPHN